MRHLVESHAFPPKISAYIYIYIYIYIKYSHLERKKKSFITSVLSTSVKNPYLNKIFKKEKEKSNLLKSRMSTPCVTMETAKRMVISFL